MEKAVVGYLLKANVNCITSMDIANLFGNSNNTHQAAEKGEGKERKGISSCFSASLMKLTFYSSVLGYCFFERYFVLITSKQL